MGKYHRMHNVVGFVCNLHEFIKHLSAIFLLCLFVAFYEKLKFIADCFYDVIISPLDVHLFANDFAFKGL